MLLIRNTNILIKIEWNKEKYFLLVLKCVYNGIQRRMQSSIEFRCVLIREGGIVTKLTKYTKCFEDPALKSLMDSSRLCVPVFTMYPRSDLSLMFKLN